MIWAAVLARKDLTDQKECDSLISRIEDMSKSDFTPRQEVNKCILYCPVCSKHGNKSFTNSNDFMSHWRLCHLPEKRPDVARCLLRKVTHNCRLCGYQMLHDRGMIGRHTSTYHKMKLKDYMTRFFRDQDTVDAPDDLLKCSHSRGVCQALYECVFECKFCPNDASKKFHSKREFTIHVKRAHSGITNPSSKSHWTLVKKAMHDCRICGKKYLCDRMVITEHLKGVHQSIYNITEYIQKYFPRHFDEDGGIKLSNFSYEEKETKGSTGCNHQTSVCRAFYNCTYECLMCDLSPFTSIYSMRQHAAKYHHEKESENEVQSTSWIFKRKSYHKCRDCDQRVLSDHHYLRYHMRHCVQGDFKNYISRYYPMHFESNDGIPIQNFASEESVEGHNQTLGCNHMKNICQALNECIYKCNLCEKILSKRTECWSHMKKQHGTSAKINHNHVLLKKTVHECRRCQKEVICDRTDLNEHVNRRCSTGKFSSLIDYTKEFFPQHFQTNLGRPDPEFGRLVDED